MVVSESEYATNKTATGYNQSEMDEKYLPPRPGLMVGGGGLSHHLVHESMNCQLI
jgi:hypothetical protein